MAFYVALLLALHKRLSKIVLEFRECVRPRALNLGMDLLVGCFESALLGNRFKKHFVPHGKLKALLFFL